MSEPTTVSPPAADTSRRTWNRVELALIVVAVAGCWLATSGLRWELSLGKLLAYSAALLLGQGLARDVLRILLRPRAGSTRRIKCLCGESSLGLVLLIAGLGLLFLGIRDQVVLGRLGLSGLVAGVLVTGFVAKDYILVIRRETDHATIRVD